MTFFQCLECPLIFKTVNKATLTSLVSDIYYYDGKAKQAALCGTYSETTSHNIWPFVFDMKTHSKNAFQMDNKNGENDSGLDNTKKDSD